MKKKIISILLTVALIQILSGYAYAKKCPKCIEDCKNNKTRFDSIGIAHRDFERPIVHKDGKAYAWYRCQFGHNFLVDLSE